MAKPELGTKRLCGSCGAKFYDLNKEKIVCPKCSTVFVVAAPPVRARAEPAQAARPQSKAPVVVAPETQDAEFVSLEDADAEAQGKLPAGDAVEGDDEIEGDEAIDDAAFIEEQEDGDPDVTDIIGDGIEKEEET